LPGKLLCDVETAPRSKILFGPTMRRYRESAKILDFAAIPVLR